MGRLRRLAVAVAVGGALGTLATGCTQTSDGSAQWISGQASKPIDGSDAENLAVARTDVEDLVGADLPDVFETDTPLEDGDLGDCEVLGIKGQVALLGDDWDGFYLRNLDDAPNEDEDADHIVLQVAAVYPDAEGAATAFESAGRLAEQCDGQERRTAEGYTWMPTIADSTDSSYAWTAEQTDLVSQEWRCSGDARRRNNVVIRAFACTEGQDGPETAAAVANAISDTVWELSSPRG